MPFPRHARKWSLSEIVADARKAQDEFRRRRFGEPKDLYLKAFEALERANSGLIPT